MFSLMPGIPTFSEQMPLTISSISTPAALAILAAVAVYGGLVIALGAIEHDDLMLMPKGEKIAKILHL